jgi:hypothetical protein
MSSTRENPTKSYNVKSDDPKINGAHLLKRSHQKKPALPRSTAPISIASTQVAGGLTAAVHVRPRASGIGDSHSLRAARDVSTSRVT